MHNSVQNLIEIKNKIKLNLDSLKISNLPKIVAVSKTFKIDKILPLIEHGHVDFGENKVQEALDKWTDVLEKNNNIQLHMIGKLQTNKVKFAVKLFNYIHSVDNEILSAFGSTGTDLKIRTDGDILLKEASTGNDLASFKSSGACELYYNNSKKIETTNIGAIVTGGLNINGRRHFVSDSGSFTTSVNKTWDALTYNATDYCAAKVLKVRY